MAPQSYGAAGFTHMNEMRYGRLDDEPIAEYHAAPAISHTKLSYFEDNFPATYHQKYIAKTLEPEDPKEHFDIGQAVESLLVGTDTYKKAVAVNRQWADFKSAAARAWRDETRAAGVIPLSQDNDALVHRMRDAVMRNPDAAALIAAGKPQVTFRSRGKHVAAQCRSDWFSHTGTTLPSDGAETGPYDCDLKTIESLAPAAFISFDKQAVQLRYHHAAVWYAYVIRRVFAEMYGDDEQTLPFVKRYFIVVDKKQFPSATVYTLPAVLWELAEVDLFRDYEPLGTVQRLVACYANNSWPDAPIRREIEIPRYIK